MKKLDDILKLKQFYKDHLYSQVRVEQRDDQTYYDDTFAVPEVKQPHKIYRSGLGVRIIDAPAEQIVTSNPQVFIEAGNKEKALNLSTLINETWIPIIKRQNPEPFKDSIKNPLLRGESYIRLVANPTWTQGKYPSRIGLPIIFTKPDPMVIFGSPEEDENGRPREVIVFYERQPKDLLPYYPNWKNPKNRTGENNDLVEWFEYWDEDTRYIEADEDVIVAPQKNIYGCVPFVRRYSGFGRRSPDGELSNLIVSDIRRSRDLLLEECVTRSNIASIQYLFAHKDVMITTSGEVNEENLRENLKLGAYAVNVLQNMPEDMKIELGLSKDMEQISDSTLQHHRDIIGELSQRHPFILAGFPYGTSGRQQDMTEVAAMRRYDSVVENAESMWATAFEMAIKICNKLDLPLPKVDTSMDFQCSVSLKAKDPIENDRRITLGNRLWNMGQGSISLRTNHVDYQGMTEEQSKKEFARLIAEKLTIGNPNIQEVLAMVGAQEGGMEAYLEQMNLRANNIEDVVNKIPKTTEERIEGEVRSVEGEEESSPRGARQGAEGYNRGS